METKVPDFSKLIEQLLRPFRLIELQPFGLTDNGYAVLLLPARNGKPIIEDGVLNTAYLDPASLPVLDLKEAGIETDRRPQTIMADVEKLLQGRRFSIEPNFEVLPIFDIVREVGVTQSLKLLEISLQWARPFGPPLGLSPKQEMEDLVRRLPPIGFTLDIEGSPIKGLDLTKPVKGFMGVIAIFILPAKAIPEGTPELSALRAAMEFYRAMSDLKNKKQAGDKYNKRRHLPLLNKKKRMKRVVAKAEQRFTQAANNANTALAALPA